MSLITNVKVMVLCPIGQLKIAQQFIVGLANTNKTKSCKDG